MEDDGNSSNNTNDKNDTAEIIQGGETSHIIKNDANNIMNNKKRTRTDEYEDSIFGNPWKDIKSGTTAIMAANILQELNRKYGNRNNNKNNFYNNYRNNRGRRSLCRDEIHLALVMGMKSEGRCPSAKIQSRLEFRGEELHYL